MSKTNDNPNFLNSKYRKIVQYSLLIIILIIQIGIAGYFYNEFNNKRDHSFIEKQLGDLKILENITNNSKKELGNAQNLLKEFLVTDEKQYLDSYFLSLNKVGKELKNIDGYKDKFPDLKMSLESPNKPKSLVDFKKSLDSTIQNTPKLNINTQEGTAKIEKIVPKYNFEKYDIVEKKKSDSVVKKKGLFGRLKNAISGDSDVKKDTIDEGLNKNKPKNSVKLKKEVDSIINVVNNYYNRVTSVIFKEKAAVQKNNIQSTEKNNKGFYNLFTNHITYSNALMDMYEKGIKDSKLKIENEYALQNSTSNKIRNYLILGMMILMFLASILIIYLTRISFVYETKLNAANIQINENLNFKNRILGMLSHELRAPLKIIGIFIKKINKKVDDETVKGYLKSISFTNETLLMQSNLILEYTKNQHAKNSLNLEIFDLKKEVESIAIALEPYIETRNNTFTIQNNVPENLLINSDSKKINQLFINILGNANKFTENGKIHATISTENIKNNRVLLSVSIKDNGVGISKSDLENIFKPYYQGILSEDVENLGAGLGLSLCKEIVELYEGEISVSSEQNAGTTVNFSLYLAKYDGK